jgi:hypothetical protein
MAGMCKPLRLSVLMRIASVVGVLTALGSMAAAAPAASGPRIYWISDPVRPDETVVLQGGDFGTNATVEIAPVGTKRWTRTTVLQGSDDCLKFFIPADWKMDVFSCRVTAGGSTSPVASINAPDPWWLQGDAGETATPGGWLRVLGKCLNFGGRSGARLESEAGEALALAPTGDDGYSLTCAVPGDLTPGPYKVQVHNGLGGDAAWREAGTIRIETPPAWPTNVFSVLESRGGDAEKEMRKSLVKYRDVKDHTEGIHAALKKAKENGGGVVYFPAGRYGVQGELAVPPRTVLRGEGAGLVVLWWGSGRFNLDGGSALGYERKADAPKPPPNMIFGRDFAIEDLSLYLPPDYETAIAAWDNVRIRRVRVRIDHYWTLHTERYEGCVARLGKNCEVTDCDLQAKGTALTAGEYILVARNRIAAGKTHCPLGGSRQAIVEDNQFVSTHPTAYQNIAGQGRNIYYARNRHEALNVHQADFSFTFDAGAAAYKGGLAEVRGTHLTLAADPRYPDWAKEGSRVWKSAAVCVLNGRGAGQYRMVVANQGRAWEVDRPFDIEPDRNSVVSIVSFNGRVLVIGNRFEDANWVNAGYGTSIDVVYAGNHLVRCAQLVNYGLETDGDLLPSWYVQYLGNELLEGHTSADTTGSVRHPEQYAGPITRCTVHRRNAWAGDNSGSITVSGRTRDALVEGCVLHHPLSVIRADGEASGLVFRKNTFDPGPPRYEGGALERAVVLPPP